MKILIEMGTLSDVHLFKYVIKSLQSKGHEMKAVVRETKGITSLLEAYAIKYDIIGKIQKGLLRKMLNLVKVDYNLLKAAKEFDPDLFVGSGSAYAAQVSRILDRPSIMFDDDDIRITLLYQLLYAPFSSVIITPFCFSKDLGLKHIRVNSYKELAYLHPNNFQPDPSILDLLDISKVDKFVILRFGTLTAYHDIGITGFCVDDIRNLVRILENYARVFISTDKALPSDLSNYAIKIPPHKLHDLLYYASLLVGDTQTLTTEAAVLGTPAIRCNSFVGINDISNFIELEKKYDLIYSFREPRKAIEKALELIKDGNLKSKWLKKREHLLREKIDMTEFLTKFIENYPESFLEYKRNEMK